MAEFSIGNVDLGEGLPALVIAEIGLNHNGSLTLAHKLVDAAALAGASLVKFQKRSPADLATAQFLDAPFPKCPLFGRSQREVRARLELAPAALRELRDHARELGLLFSMSAFDLPSLEAAVALEVPVLKLASHSMTHAPLLEAAAGLGLPIIASMGGCTWEERDRAVAVLSRAPLAVLHCVSAYPCPDALVKLDTIGELRRRYRREVGYSGHEAGIDVTVAATVLGASIVERHLTLNRAMVGLDHGVSLEPAEFAEMVLRIRRLERVRGVAERPAAEEAPSRQSYHVAVCTRHAIAASEVLLASDLVLKQPRGREDLFFGGFELDAVAGKRALRALPADEPVPREAVGR